VVAEQRFAGIDWASEEHAVFVNDAAGRIVEGGVTVMTSVESGHCARGCSSSVWSWSLSSGPTGC
jgi:hypothetical protein